MDPRSVPISPSQRRMLVTLKRREEATADELADELGISSSAVRQHLGALRSAGLVTSHQERGQTGRPADRYHATERAEQLFASSEGSLLIELLELIEEEDPELVNRVFERRRRRMADRIRDDLADETIDHRVDALTRLLDEQGYLADCERFDDGRFRVKLHSCAIWSVARHHQQACANELDLIRDVVPDATVERVTYKANGAHTCAYEIVVHD